MNLWQLAKASLTHYWRMHAAVLGGVVVTAAVLSGALAVGDSVKESLKRRAMERIANVRWAVVGSDRFFTEGLVERVAGELGTKAAGIVQVEGSVANEEGSARANRVQVHGVDEIFWEMGEVPTSSGFRSAQSRGVGISLRSRGSGEGGGDEFLGVNEALAARLGVVVGDIVVVRVEIPGSISRDAPLSGSADETVSIRRKVTRIIAVEEMGGYALRNEQSSPLNLFLERDYLQGLLEQEGRVNVMLAGEARNGEGRELEMWEVEDALEKHWDLADASMRLAEIHGGRKWSLSSERVFLDRRIAEAAREIVGPSDGVLTYLVNGIESGGRVTPYSMVTAAGSQTHSLFPEGLQEGGIMVTRWLADDLGVKRGDEVTLRYFVVMNGRELREDERTLRVAGVLPMGNAELNADWTPEFPGISDAENCRDWEPGTPVDLDAIRDMDEDYWDEYGATPKAFIGLRTGQEMWGNRFGDLTGLHFLTGRLDEEEFLNALKERVGPEEFGLQVRDVRGEAAAAVSESLDFGMLFASMSFFLMLAALILTGLLFAFGVEQRAEQIGLCLAVGISKAQVRRWFLTEALVVSLAGVLAGTVVGVLYTRLALWGLGGIWADAVAGMRFVYAADGGSLVGAALGAVVLSMAAVYVASRVLMRIEPKALISGSHGAWGWRRKPLVRCVSFWLGLATLLGGVGMVFVPAATSKAKQEAFFSAGMLLLVAGICGCVLLWRAMEERGTRWKGTLWALGRSYALGRRGRSLAIVGVMAAGVFMVTAMNAMRLNARADAEANSSGTGGFQYMAESTLPVYENLNSAAGRAEFGLEEAGEFTVVQVRVRAGDDASCLNLNRAQKPRLLGVDSRILAERGSFSAVAAVEGVDVGAPWRALEDGENEGGEGDPSLLRVAAREDVVPGVIDQNTAVFALGKRLGDVVEYEDARGNAFKVRLVAFLANSVLQGNILIAEDEFTARYPDAGGFRMFFVDAPTEEEGARVVERMSRMLEDRGFAAVPTWQRLGEFNAVQNTYLSIFSTLGGLGVLLGTAGLAVLVGRNVLERRGQLGLMRAMGFEERDLARLVLAEHWFLHVLGVVLGLGAALVAVSSQLTERGGDMPAGLLVLVVGGILAGGLIFCWWAARLAVRIPLLESIRGE